MRVVAVLLATLAVSCGGADLPTDAEGSDLTSGVHLIAGEHPDLARPVPYHGGPVLHRPLMVNLYWGSYFNTTAGRKETALFDSFKQHAGGSDWFAIAAQYTDAKGPVINASVEGASLLVSADPPAQLTDSAMAHFVAAQIDAGNLEWNPEAIYFVYTPPSTIVHLGKAASCTDFCGYHEHHPATLAGIGDVQLVYASIPHLDCESVCGTGSLDVNGALLDAATSAMSHELAEAATDPLFNAWEAMHANDEVGDRCETAANNFAQSWDGQRFAIQQIWSNQTLSCLDRQ